MIFFIRPLHLCYSICEKISFYLSAHQKAPVRLSSYEATPQRQNSRQSMSRLSSSLSVITSATKSDTATEYEASFPKRWEEEIKLDINLNLLKRKHVTRIRTLKMNDVHKRLLNDKLTVLSNSFSSIEKKLNKETKCIKEEIEENMPDLEYGPNIGGYLPKIESASPQDSCRSRSRTRGWSRYNCKEMSHDQLCQSCMFDASNSKMRCRNFPCFLPKTYHSLGLMHESNTYSVVGNYKQLLNRCHDLRPPTSQKGLNKHDRDFSNSTETESHATRTTAREKIRGLKQLVKEMKEQNENNKPRDWAINYGDPVPWRILLKPVKIYVE